MEPCENYFSDLYGLFDFWDAHNNWTYPRKDPELGYDYLWWMLYPNTDPDWFKNLTWC